ncbi:MAG: ABC transporter permease [Pseudanabaenaceae cyanobacterium]
MLYQAIAVARRVLLELWRQKRSLILWAVFPVCLAIINGLVLAEGARLDPREAFAFVTPATVVGAGLFFSCLGGTVATIVAERESRTLKRLLISQLRGTAYYLGILLAYIYVGLGQTILVYAVGTMWGVRFQGAVWLGGLIILLCIAGYVGTGFLLGTTWAKRTEDVNSLVAGIGVPLLMLGGAFFPPRYLPANLAQLAQFNPIYHISSALVLVSSAGADFSNISLVSHFIFLVGFVLVGIAAGALTYGKLLRRERQL